MLGGVGDSRFQEELNKVKKAQHSITGRVTELETSIAGIRQGNGACSWKDIGYDKSHFHDTGKWCPAGSFISQIDLNGCNQGAGNCPIIGRVLCCEIVPTAPSPR